MWSAPAGAAANSPAQYPDSKVVTQAKYCSVDGCQNTPVLHSSGCSAGSVCTFPVVSHVKLRVCSSHLFLVHVRASKVRFSSCRLKMWSLVR